MVKFRLHLPKCYQQIILEKLDLAKWAKTAGRQLSPVEMFVHLNETGTDRYLHSLNPKNIQNGTQYQNVQIPD